MIVWTGVRGLSFTNVVFEHATWNGPSTPVGFVDVQAGFCLACAVGEEHNCLPDPGDSPEHPPPPSLKFRETPAALAFHGSKDVRFDSCTFQHLGANGVSFSGGSQNNTVARCTFVDLSASAVAIGTRGNPTIRGAEHQQDKGNEVSDCSISHVAREYRGHPALLAGFSRGQARPRLVVVGIWAQTISAMTVRTGQGSSTTRFPTCR